MMTRNRRLTVLLAACYLQAVTASSLFHQHGCRTEGPHSPGVSAAHHNEAPHGECSVCQFLAQKPAPTPALPPALLSSLAQEVIVPAPPRLAAVVFSSWRSRAPPPLV